MEQRFKEIDGRLDKVEYRQERLEAEQKKSEIESAKTEVYVKEIYKKWMPYLLLEFMRTTSTSKWEQFFAKALRVILGVVGSYVATKDKF